MPEADVVAPTYSPPVAGGTNWKGQIVFANQGRGADIPPSLAVVNPYEPFNSSILLNNYFGRQFNSLNDIRVHPKSKDIYFTDTCVANQ